MTALQNHTGRYKLLKKFYNKLQINPSRVNLEKLVGEAAESLQPVAKVLDAGSGGSPYRNLFSHVDYHSTDLFISTEAARSLLSFICDLSCIPICDECYDLVLCTQVLEHVKEPTRVLEEFHRILKPGKKLWISVPLTFAEHQEPNDFYRYTQFGLKYLLEKAGFEVIRLESLEGYYGTLAYQLGLAARHLPIGLKKNGRSIWGITASISSFFLKPILLVLSFYYQRLELHNKLLISGICKNYYAIAIKINKEKPQEVISM